MIYYGIIENNDDTSHEDGLKLGRCQVRVFGKHTDNRSESNDNDYIPTADLPWFDMMMPVTSAGHSRNYDTPFVKNGTICVIEYLDPDEQFGIIKGILLRQPKELPDFLKGFTDPDSVYPNNDDLNKSPLYPCATGEVDSIIQDKIDNVETAANLGFEEPATPYNPTYTKNKVISSGSHIFEFDETPGKERVNIYHKSGTFTETHPDGTKVTKVVVDDYKITLNDSFELTKGSKKVEISGDADIHIEGKSTITSTGDMVINAKSKTILNSDGDVNVNANTKCIVTSPDTTLTGGKVTIAGVVTPGVGAFNCLTRCIFSGAVHSGAVTEGA